MTLMSRHIMASNQRLIRQIERELFDDAEKSWVKVYSSFCKKHGELDPSKIMQFKYKGELFKLEEDVPLRGGVKQLHPDLIPEFESAYIMFVQEVETEKRILKNMLAHAIRIAKYTEDLLELLPEIMHHAVTEAGFFQEENKPLMSVDQAQEFKDMYGQYFSLFDLRKSVGALV